MKRRTTCRNSCGCMSCHIHNSKPKLPIHVQGNKHEHEWTFHLKLHTIARHHLAKALVIRIGHKQIATRIDGHALGPEEAGVGPEPVGKRASGAIDPARQRGHHCPRAPTSTSPSPASPPQPTVRLRQHHHESNNVPSVPHSLTCLGVQPRARPCCHTNCPQKTAQLTDPIHVPPSTVTLRMRLLFWSTTNTLPLASTATPVGT
jgi:hypothetical protein